jgi:hypothetical protein
MQAIIENNRVHLVLFGMQNRTFGPFLAAMHSIGSSLQQCAIFHNPPLGHLKLLELLLTLRGLIFLAHGSPHVGVDDVSASQDAIRQLVRHRDLADARASGCAHLGQQAFIYIHIYIYSCTDAARHALSWERH